MIDTVFVVLDSGRIQRAGYSSSFQQADGRTTYHLDDSTILTTERFEDAVASPSSAHVAETFDGAKRLLVARKTAARDAEASRFARAQTGLEAALAVAEDDVHSDDGSCHSSCAF